MADATRGSSLGSDSGMHRASGSSSDRQQSNQAHMTSDDRVASSDEWRMSSGATGATTQDASADGRGHRRAGSGSGHQSLDEDADVVQQLFVASEKLDQLEGSGDLTERPSSGDVDRQEEQHQAGMDEAESTMSRNHDAATVGEMHGEEEVPIDGHGSATGLRSESKSMSSGESSGGGTADGGADGGEEGEEEDREAQDDGGDSMEDLLEVNTFDRPRQGINMSRLRPSGLSVVTERTEVDETSSKLEGNSDHLRSSSVAGSKSRSRHGGSGLESGSTGPASTRKSGIGSSGGVTAQDSGKHSDPAGFSPANASAATGRRDSGGVASERGSDGGRNLRRTS